MSYNKRNPKQALNKAFLKIKPYRANIEIFKGNLKQLFDGMDESETEEFHKNLLISCLKNTHYLQNFFNIIKGYNDLVIHSGTKASDTVVVIIEVKSRQTKAK